MAAKGDTAAVSVELMPAAEAEAEAEAETEAAA